MKSETRQLTAAIAAGDPVAFTRFYEEWFDQMLVQVRIATGQDEAFCMDVVQDAMLRVIRGMPVIEEEAALAAWTRRVTLSAAYDMLRKEQRLRKRERGAAGSEQAAAAEDDERLARLREQLSELAPGEDALLRMRFTMGLTLARIGALVGLGAGAVDGRIGRIVRRLRAGAGEGDHE